MFRSHCIQDIQQDKITVSICGWVKSMRHHRKILFIDLRDHTGSIQAVMKDNHPDFNQATHLSLESVIQISGMVHLNHHNNNEMQAEIQVESYQLLNVAAALPFQIEEQVSEEVRLKYRYLDLRRQEWQDRIKMKALMYQSIRTFLISHHFLEIETPLLTRSTPEGAREYMVPSRIYPGKAFALPQSPQLFKQILMASSIFRYFQIVKCFRDEDLRADRQPEFTQLDLEMSFITQEEVMNLIEKLILQIFSIVKPEVSFMEPFLRLSYQDAMRYYGSDKPDLRIENSLEDLTTTLEKEDSKQAVIAYRVPKKDDLKKNFDRFHAKAKEIGCDLNYLFYHEQQWQWRKKTWQDSPQSIAMKLKPIEQDIIFCARGEARVVTTFMGELRCSLGQKTKKWAPLWVINFPLFEQKEDHLAALHHPFTAPQGELKADALAQAYDFVLNGVEIGGGSIRIHQVEMQLKIFKLLGIDPTSFQFFVNALQFGCPPHGGIALGLDRLLMMLLELPSIRDVIVFPKTQSSICPLTNAPS